RLQGDWSSDVCSSDLVLLDGMRIEAGEDAFSPNAPPGFPFASYQQPLPPGPLRLDDLNPDDIESIDVVSGAASAAIYGPGTQARSERASGRGRVITRG